MKKEEAIVIIDSLNPGVIIKTSASDEKIKEAIGMAVKALQKEPKKCMYSKDDYTDEDRKVLCNGCKEECEYSKSDDFTISLAECISQAQVRVVDPMVLAETWKDELIKLAKSEEPVSKVWHDVEENPEENRDFAFVDYNGVMWSRYRIEDLCHSWKSYVNMTGMTKWAYTSDLIKL